MKKNKITQILLCLFAGICYSQVGIGTQSPNVNTILDMGTNNNKGVIFPRVETFTDLPKYNSSAPDNFDNDDTMDGMITYVNSEKMFYTYDGNTWIKMNSISPKGNPNLSRFGTSNDQNVFCSLGFCGVQLMDMDRYNNPDNYLIDNLGVHATDENGNGVIQIAEDGLYRISPAIKVSGGGATLGDVTIYLALDVNYKKQDGSYNGWRPLAQEDNSSLGLIVNADTNADISYSITSYFKAGDQIRMKWDINASLITVAVNYNSGTVPNRTYLSIEKIN